MVVFFIFLEVLGQLINFLGENSHLYFRGAGVCFVQLVLADNFVFSFFDFAHDFRLWLLACSDSSGCTFEVYTLVLVMRTGYHTDLR